MIKVMKKYTHIQSTTSSHTNLLYILIALCFVVTSFFAIAMTSNAQESSPTQILAAETTSDMNDVFRDYGLIKRELQTIIDSLPDSELKEELQRHMAQINVRFLTEAEVSSVEAVVSTSSPTRQSLWRESVTGRLIRADEAISNIFTTLELALRNN